MMQELFSKNLEHFDITATQVAMYSAYVTLGTVSTLLNATAEAMAVMLSEKSEHKQPSNKSTHGRN